MQIDPAAKPFLKHLEPLVVFGDNRLHENDQASKNFNINMNPQNIAPSLFESVKTNDKLYSNNTLPELKTANKMNDKSPRRAGEAKSKHTA